MYIRLSAHISSGPTSMHANHCLSLSEGVMERSLCGLGLSKKTGLISSHNFKLSTCNGYEVSSSFVTQVAVKIS